MSVYIPVSECFPVKPYGYIGLFRIRNGFRFVEIVSAIESGELDVDALTEKVKRASELIAFCKEKLTKTDKELQKILEDIS